MRIAIVGATGNIGTASAERLAADHELRLAARRQPSTGVAPHVGHDFLALDIVQDDLNSLLDGVDAVVHLAWLFQPSHQPHLTWQNNVVGTSRLLEAASA